MLCQPRGNKDTGLALASMLMSGVWIAAMCSYAFSRRRGHRDGRAQFPILSDYVRRVADRAAGWPIRSDSLPRVYRQSHTYVQCVQYKRHILNTYALIKPMP